MSFTYTRPIATFYVTIGSLDNPEAARIEKQFGVESKVSWVEFCEAVPSERTAENLTPELEAWFAGMQIRQAEIS